MGKFNKTTGKGISNRPTTNLAGGSAYERDTKSALAHLLLTSMLNGDKFYQKETDTVKQLRNLIDKLPNRDKAFAGKAAIYGRDVFGLRSASHVAAAHIGQTVKGEEWTKNFFHKVCVRPDDPMEILSCYWEGDSGNAVPNSMKKGFKRYLEGLNDYRLAKYRKENAGINMYDLVNLVHAHSESIDKLMNGTLATAETWETKKTQAGQKAEDEEEKAELNAQAWTELLKSRKLPYMATLKNLRNIAIEAPDALDMALEVIVHEKLIEKSRVLPFRYLTVYKLFKYDEDVKTKLDGAVRRKILSALNRAAGIAMGNVPKLDGKTMVAIDVSGSMSNLVTNNPVFGVGKANGTPYGRWTLGSGGFETTDITLFEAGAMLGIAMAMRNNSDILLFSNNGQYFDIDPDSSVFANLEAMYKKFGGGTNWCVPFEVNNRYDRMIVISDEMGWIEGYNRNPQTMLNDYKARINPNVKVYVMDVAGYGTASIAGNGVASFAGFSEKVFDIIKQLEVDPRALVNEIEKISL